MATPRKKPRRSTRHSRPSSLIGSSSARRMHIETLEDRRLLAVFSVGNLNNLGPGSLRGAINQANSTSGPDTIVFNPSVFTGGANSLIRLTSGELEITDTLMIDGSTGIGVTITADANDDDITDATNITDVAASFGGTVGAADDLMDDNSRVLNFSSTTGDLFLQGLALTGGHSSYDGGGIRFHSSGQLTLTRSTVSGNSTTGPLGHGGGMYTNSGDVRLMTSTVSGNSTADGHGGGVFTNSGDVRLTSSTVSGNRTARFGAGIYTISGDVSLASSTVSGNAAKGAGGGVYFTTSLTIESSIVAGNIDNGTAPDLIPGSTLRISHSLIGDNTGTSLTEAQTPDGNGNLIGSAAGTGIIDPLLRPLANNGGPTLTHALLTGSPAINAGDPKFTAPPETDQRGPGFHRVQGGRVDVGAFEVQNAPCDFVSPLGCDIHDINALYAGTNGAPSPLTDTLINQWLSDAGHVSGDADLDGDVDSTDLGILLNNFGSGRGWGAGNLNSDGEVNSTDLGLLLNNFGVESVAVAAAFATALPRVNVNSLLGDVNGDGKVTPLDALQVINALNDGDRSTMAMDLDGDGVVAPADALLVVNRLQRTSMAADRVFADLGTEAEEDEDALPTLWTTFERGRSNQDDLLTE